MARALRHGRVRSTADSILLNCGAPVGGNYDWSHIDFGYTYEGSSIVEWGMDDGDGDSYVSHDEADARQDLFWHKYYSPGSYRAAAWVVDSVGRRDDATCTFTWFGGSNGGGGGSPSCADGDDYYFGDLDCEDPNGRDGDGDGIGCEGW